MPIWMKAAGKWGSILVLVALLITFLKQAIAFLGFLTFAIKVFVILIFIALIVGVGLLALRSFNDRRKAKE